MHHFNDVCFFAWGKMVVLKRWGIVKRFVVANIKKVIFGLFYIKNVTFFIFSIAKSNIYFYNRKGVQYIILEK
ncbi:hypothetical protein AT258_27030 [Bacillus wiedmannii]|nr:hypothetical protein AT258_27030 [Bacillus wiedmannii]